MKTLKNNQSKELYYFGNVSPKKKFIATIVDNHKGNQTEKNQLPPLQTRQQRTKENPQSLKQDCKARDNLLSGKLSHLWKSSQIDKVS